MAVKAASPDEEGAGDSDISLDANSTHTSHTLVQLSGNNGLSEAPDVSQLSKGNRGLDFEVFYGNPVIDGDNLSEDKAPSALALFDNLELLSPLDHLPTPPQHVVRVHDLHIEAPAASVPLPLPMPVYIPHSFARRLGLANGAPETRELLHGVSFTCLPGEVLAIIGGSGSGKTTALNSVAFRTANLRQTSGTVTLEKVDSSAKLYKRNISTFVGYVRQDDLLLPYLTVRETLSFSANLRLPASMTEEARKVIVEQTLAELGLNDVADVIVGGAYRKGISGGERRRLSIGCVLVTLPSVLVLDEPTTGLDATTAFQILEMLSRLARRGRTVILSVHQPRSDAYVLFDRLCLLSSGSVVYSGPRIDALPYFHSLGLGPSIHTNPLDFMLEISSVDRRRDDVEAESSHKVQRLISSWAGHLLADRVKVTDTAVAVPMYTGSTLLDAELGAPAFELVPSLHTIARATLPRQILIVSRRTIQNLYRDRPLLYAFAAQTLVAGSVTGAIFYLGSSPTSVNGIQTFKTLLFQGPVSYFYLTFVLYLFLVCSSLTVFDREREDGLYGAIPMVVSTIFAYAPVNIVFNTIYGVILYFLCGLRRDNLAASFLQWIGSTIMQGFSMLALAVLMGSLTRNLAEASTIGQGIAMIYMLTGGYVIIDLPRYIAWARFLNPYYYGFHWSAVQQLSTRVFMCDESIDVQSGRCLGSGVLASLAFPDYPAYISALGLLGYVLIVLMIATLILHYFKTGGQRFAKQQLANPYQAQVQHADKIKHRHGDVTVTLDGVRLTVRSPRVTSNWKGSGPVKPVCILQGVSASFKPGHVTAVLGPSGSGKTSLLQILGRRLTKLSAFTASGSILFNGQPMSDDSRASMGYLEQHDDHHLPALTVRETLHYAALLQLRGMSANTKHARAEEVLRTLGLTSCADNLVGGELVKGISGGEKRRLSLAIELLSDPAVLLVDEPTSGLDSFNARSVMQALRAIADTGRTVIVSIHQPSSEIWTDIDDVLILAKGGRTVAFSPRERILEDFAASGAICPDFYNPADFILDTVAIDTRTEDARTKTTQRLDDLIETLRHNEADVSKEASGNLLTARRIGIASDYTNQRLGVALPVVFRRSLKNLTRQRDVLVVRIANSPFLAVLFWLFFLRFDLSPESAQTRVGLFQENSALTFVGMLTTIAIFPKERDAFLHERMSAARYSCGTFLLSYTAQEIPMQAVAALLYSIITVYGMGLQAGGRIFFEYAFAVFVLLNAGESVGIAVFSLISNGGLSVSILTVVLTFQNQLSGIMSVSVPYGLQVIAWAFPIKPASLVFLINEMRGLRFDCSAQDVAVGRCLAATGDELLQVFNLEDGSTAKYIGILAGLAVIYRLLAYLCVRIKVKYL